MHRRLAPFAIASVTCSIAAASSLMAPPHAPADAHTHASGRPLAIETAALRPTTPATGTPAVPTPTPPANPTAAHHDMLVDTVTERGQRARGLYFPGTTVQRMGTAGMIRLLRSSHLDAAVIDLKDGQGRVTYNTAIPDFQQQRRNFIPDLRTTITELKAGGIYTIARIVCFSDPQLPRRRMDLAVRDNRPGRRNQPWVSWGTGGTWLDPTNPENQENVRLMAVEAAEAGFDEVQLDYIRFPVDEGTRYAIFAGEDGSRRRRDILLNDVIRRVDESIAIPIGVDVFGLTALNEGDPAGLGQSLSDWTPHVDVFTPMLYINGFKRWRRGTERRAATFVYVAVNTLRNRLGPVPVIRPFLQAFPNGADYFNPELIAEQIRAARGAEADGFLFWHPGGNYGMVQQSMNSAARGMSPFPIAARQAERTAATQARASR